jgi:hypothetical protein
MNHEHGPFSDALAAGVAWLAASGAAWLKLHFLPSSVLTAFTFMCLAAGAYQMRTRRPR